MDAHDLTIFVISCGSNPNYRDTLSAVQAQTAVRDGAQVQEIRNVAPMSKAFQEMIDRCQTRYFIQVDEDMLLQPDAAAIMLETIRKHNSPPGGKVAFAVWMLHDIHLDMPIQGVKIYDREIMAKYPYRSTSEVISCEKDQLERMHNDGYTTIESSQMLGAHSPKWTPRLIFNRYLRLMEKWKQYGYGWLEDMPARLLAKYTEDPNEINKYAFLGAWASASRQELFLKGEDDFREVPKEYLLARSWFSPPTQATFFMSDRCNLKCSWCARQGGMLKVSPAPHFDATIVDEMQRRFPTIKSACLCGFGETLLNPNLANILDRCKKYGIFTGLITNGTLLANALPVLLEHRPGYISISLNAASAEEHVKECNVPGAWQQIMNGIAAIQSHEDSCRALHSTDRGIPLYLSRVCTTDNILGVPAFLKLAMDLKIVRGVDLHNILPHDVSTKKKEAEFLKQVLTVKHADVIQNLKTFPGAYLVRSWPVLIDPDHPSRNCELSFQQLAIDGNRHISVCNSIMPPQPENGSIRDAKCWRNDYAQEFRLSFSDDRLPAWCKWCFRNCM